MRKLSQIKCLKFTPSVYEISQKMHKFLRKYIKFRVCEHYAAREKFPQPPVATNINSGWQCWQSWHCRQNLENINDWLICNMVLRDASATKNPKVRRLYFEEVWGFWSSLHKITEWGKSTETLWQKKLLIMTRIHQTIQTVFQLSGVRSILLQTSYGGTCPCC